MSRRPILGIDLGTTFSLVSVLQDGRPVLLPNAIGETLTPSAVGVDDDGTLLVGAPARARAATHPEETVLAFKRDMGTERTWTLGRRVLRPVDLSAMVLAALKADAEAALGTTIDEAVITVPAYFGDAQRQATRDAGAIAGLRVDRIVNEPTAAALAYGLHAREREMRCVVLDLGGGTFDVTVLEIIEGVIEIQSSAGDARLGGEDFTDVLAALAAQRLELTPTRRGRARLRESCELAKRRLAQHERATIALPRLELEGGRLHDVALEISRTDAEQAWSDLLDRVRAPIARALRDAQLDPARIDEVLLVGGATRMPCFAQLAAKAFGRMPLRNLPPDEAVAHGAAVQAALVAGDAAVEDLVVTDVAPFTLGVATSERMGRAVVEGLFSPILERGTVIPASRVQRFATMEDRQTRIDIAIYQGEHSHCRDNVKLGEFALDRLPPKPAGEVRVDVRFTYDLNGILEVEAELVGTQRVEHYVVQKRPGKLSADELVRAREAMKRLKVHPRETLPNRTALARADALFVELRGAPRDALARAIADLGTALETHEREAIDAARERLNALVSELSRIL